MKLVNKFILITVTFSTVIIAQSANAAVCTVNIERAYKEAVANGWRFECKPLHMGATVGLHFDSGKRVGCAGKAPYGPTSPQYSANFFKLQGSKNGNKLKKGWKVYSYKVSGGQYTKVVNFTYQRLGFQFSASPGSNFQRHLSELKLSKKSGNCTKVYNEAF